MVFKYLLILAGIGVTATTAALVASQQQLQQDLPIPDLDLSVREEASSLLGLVIETGNRYNWSTTDTANGVVIKGSPGTTDFHNFLSCAANGTLLSSEILQDTTLRYWGYEYEGNEVAKNQSGMTGRNLFSGRFFVSEGERRAGTPQNRYDHLLRSVSNPTGPTIEEGGIVAGRTYYFMLSRDLDFRCNEGYSYSCGNGVREGSEQCDGGSDCSSLCLLTGGSSSSSSISSVMSSLSSTVSSVASSIASSASSIASSVSSATNSVSSITSSLVSSVVSSAESSIASSLSSAISSTADSSSSAASSSDSGSGGGSSSEVSSASSDSSGGDVSSTASSLSSSSSSSGGSSSSSSGGGTSSDTSMSSDSSSLTSSSLSSFASSSSSPSFTCGNGLVEVGEDCDDGNMSAGDGCAAMCSEEAGYFCTGQPSQCSVLLPNFPQIALRADMKHIGTGGTVTPSQQNVRLAHMEFQSGISESLYVTNLAFEPIEGTIDHTFLYRLRVDFNSDGNFEMTNSAYSRSGSLILFPNLNIPVWTGSTTTVELYANFTSSVTSFQIGFALNTPNYIGARLMSGSPLSGIQLNNVCTAPICEMFLTTIPQPVWTVASSSSSSIVVTPVCGNNIVEGSEECDDGNTQDGDGCFSTCRLMIPPDNLP